MKGGNARNTVAILQQNTIQRWMRLAHCLHSPCNPERQHENVRHTEVVGAEGEELLDVFRRPRGGPLVVDLAHRDVEKVRCRGCRRRRMA